MDAVAGRRQSWLNRVFGQKPGIFFVCLYAWTLTNLDQSLFGYAIPGILAEFRLPLEAAGTILTISFVFAALLIVCAGLAADRWGRGPRPAAAPICSGSPSWRPCSTAPRPWSRC